MNENEKTKWEQFKNEFKEKIGEFGIKLLDAMVNNPMLSLTLITSLVGTVGGTIRAVSNKRVMEYKNCIVKDDVTGERFLVKHPLTNDEVLELGTRIIDGEWKGNALESMDLLRNERKRKL